MQQMVKERRSIGLRELKKRRTRKEMLEVAQNLFTEYEYDDITIDQIVELANVSQKTFFNYFQNKAQFLTEYMFDWLKTIGFWSLEETPITDCRSAIIPTDAFISIGWVIEHRRILKMVMKHTDFFDFTFMLDSDSSTYDAELYETIRKPRLERVEEGQAQGFVRNDISANEICRMYDILRIDMVRRWLFLKDSEASREWIINSYRNRVSTLVNCIEVGN